MSSPLNKTENKFDEVWPGVSVGNWFSFGRDSDISGFDFFMSVALETADEDGPDVDGDEKEILSGGQTVWHYRLIDDREGSVDYQEDEILRAVARLRSARAEGKRALVTCVAGHNRSARSRRMPHPGGERRRDRDLPDPDSPRSEPLQQAVPGLAPEDTMTCPDFRTLPRATLRRWGYDIEEGEPFSMTCNGNWTKGSGGHRVHEPCEGRRDSTWWHPDDAFAYCDEHVPERDKASYTKLWDRTFREGYPFRGTAIRERVGPPFSENWIEEGVLMLVVAAAKESYLHPQFYRAEEEIRNYLWFELPVSGKKA